MNHYNNPIAILPSLSFSIIYLVLGIVVFGALSFGVIKLIKKSFSSTPKIEKTDNANKISAQKQKILDLKAREKKLKEEREDRMRAFNSR